MANNNNEIETESNVIEATAEVVGSQWDMDVFETDEGERYLVCVGEDDEEEALTIWVEENLYKVPTNLLVSEFAFYDMNDEARYRLSETIDFMKKSMGAAANDVIFRLLWEDDENIGTIARCIIVHGAGAARYLSVDNNRWIGDEVEMGLLIAVAEEYNLDEDDFSSVRFFLID